MSKIKLKNVRLSFPSLFNRATFDGVETKFEATFLLDKETQADQIAVVNKAIDALLKEKFPKGAPKSVKRTVFSDGDLRDYDGYSGTYAFKGTNNTRPTVINRDRSPIVEADNVLYAGCYVNAVVDLWYSDHTKGGKQILGNVKGVQYSKEGKPFGIDTTAADDDFDDISDEEFDSFLD